MLHHCLESTRFSLLWPPPCGLGAGPLASTLTATQLPCQRPAVCGDTADLPLCGLLSLLTSREPAVPRGPHPLPLLSSTPSCPLPWASHALPGVMIGALLTSAGARSSGLEATPLPLFSL